jgi:hypothetical protein
MQAKVYPFPRPVQRTCRICGERFPKDAPTFWTSCRQCYGHFRFRRAVQVFKAVRS